MTNRYAELVSELEKNAAIADDLESILAARGAVRAYFVRPQTLFDRDSVFDSVTCYVVTDREIIIAFSEVSYEFNAEGELLTSVQVVSLQSITDFQVLRRRGLKGPDEGALTAVALRLRWGGAWNADTLPAGCDDPSCTADHGTVSRITGGDDEILLDSSLDDETFAKGLRFIDRLQGLLARAVAR
ncbi:MAG: DUF5998 family protein [Actinomycetaceae bacterium]|nr:DUF5998 family protein [Actinomycetaceae bacterium]